MQKVKFKLNGAEREFYTDLMGVAKDFLREKQTILLFVKAVLKRELKNGL